MATKPQGKHWLDVEKVQPKSKAHEQLLAVGYGMDLAEAQEIVDGRKKDPAAYTIPELRKAQAFIEAYNAKPVVTARREMFKGPLNG